MAGRCTAAPPSTDMVVIVLGLQIRQVWRMTEFLLVDFYCSYCSFHAMTWGSRSCCLSTFEYLPDSDVQKYVPTFLSVKKPFPISSGNPIIAIQYWRSFDDLIAYSRRPANQHFRRWVNFSQKLKAGNVKSVGLYHEDVPRTLVATVTPKV
ncbi:hypothetical protein WJX84_011710 [Apatococcus fuscideae]|uniref:DUF4188 domain-containing protein n=1 Tax=Apatococcus fuscideae TaxID=2026836 RepID=A0AAW1T373_9CHLO